MTSEKREEPTDAGEPEKTDGPPTPGLSARIPHQGGQPIGEVRRETSGAASRPSEEPSPEGSSRAQTSDTDLVERLRRGDTNAHDELYRRHATAVRRYARTCCRSNETAEDLTNEVFARTLQAVRRGSGPTKSVRAYLLTSVRHVAAVWVRTEQREQLVEDFAVFAQSAGGGSGAAASDAHAPGADVQAMRAADQTLVVQAFRSLSERDQTVLWHTAVEEAKPRDVAPLLGLSDNAAAVAAHRARENLRRAYLQAHVSRSLTAGGDCAHFADRLGAYARGGLRTRAAASVHRHLEHCGRCREAAAEVMDLNERLRVLAPVAFIGWFATTGGAKTLGALLAGTGASAAADSAAGGGAAGGGAAGEGAAGGDAAAETGGAGAGGAGGSTGGAGGGEGPPGSAGLTAPVKVGLGAVAATVVGVSLALALAGSGGQESAAKPEAAASAAPEVPGAPSVQPREPGRKPTDPGAGPPDKPQRPGQDGRSGPGAETRPPAAGPGAGGHAPAPGDIPGQGPTPVPSPSRPSSPGPGTPTPPTPTPPGSPEPPPPTSSPTPPPPPPPAKVHQLNQLRLVLFAGSAQDVPTVRTVGSSWLWQRYGMRVGSTSFEHGVSVHARSSVTIDLNRECHAYDAFAGVDAITRRAGAVRFSVYGDGARLWSSRAVSGGESPVRVHVPLAGVRTLRLVVLPSTPLGRAALADWAESRISCG